MVEKPDDLVTNALALVDSVYFVARFHKDRILNTDMSRVSLHGACLVEAGPVLYSETPSKIIRREVYRLYEQGLVAPVQRRTEDAAGIITIEYIAQACSREGREARAKRIAELKRARAGMRRRCRSDTREKKGSPHDACHSHFADTPASAVQGS